MKTKLLVISAMLVNVIACKKEIVPQAGGVIHNNVAAVTKEVSEVLEQVYADHQAYVEVNRAIFKGDYIDERIPLKDLLFAKSGKKIFRERFCRILENGNYPLLCAELAGPLGLKLPKNASNVMITNDSAATVLSATRPVSIYFPYSENFGNVVIYDTLPPNSKLAIVLKPTLVYSDRDADAAPGRKPYYCSGGLNNLCWADITVTDSYAELNPTHIVTVGATPRDTTPVVLKTELVTRTYHGWSRLSRQMDKLISFTGNGGGSEIKVCRINGFLKVQDEQITNFAGDVATVHYTRADIRKKRWKRVFSVWDPNWNYQDIEQVYAVYEDDNMGSKTISGSLTTTVNLPGKLGKAEGEIGFKIGMMSQDEILTQRKFDRKSFLRDGLNNQGWGYVIDANDFLPVGKDWPIIDGGAIWSYTFPYRIY